MKDSTVQYSTVQYSTVQTVLASRVTSNLGAVTKGGAVWGCRLDTVFVHLARTKLFRKV